MVTLLPDELNKRQISKLSAFYMIIAISPPNSWSNFLLACNYEKLVLNILLKISGIKLVGSFFLATLLDVAMSDFQIWN